MRRRYSARFSPSKLWPLETNKEGLSRRCWHRRVRAQSADCLAELPSQSKEDPPGRVKSKHSCSTLLLSMSRMFTSEEYNWQQRKRFKEWPELQILIENLLTKAVRLTRLGVHRPKRLLRQWRRTQDRSPEGRVKPWRVSYVRTSPLLDVHQAVVDDALGNDLA